MAIGFTSLIVCDGTKLDPCEYSDLIELVKVVIQDLVFLSTLICIVAFCWAGFKLLFSGGNPGAMREVKSMLWKILLGYVWILAAWLIVYTITSALLVSSDYSLLGSPQ